MNRKTVEVFHALMKNGWIDRREDHIIWSYADDVEIQEELEEFKAVMGIDLFRAGDRLYMIPTQDNDLFLKNNVDYREDIKTEARTRDLYLLNYVSIYLIFMFFNGEGNDPLSREFLKKEDFIANFNKHCSAVEKSNITGDEKEKDYSDNFIQLAKVWLQKSEGDVTSKKLEHKYGVLNRILIKHEKDELFSVGEDDLIRPTRKMKDLMPYFLRKDRIIEIQNWIKEEESNAANQ